MEAGLGGVSETSGVAQARAKRDADFYASLNLKKQYSVLTLHGIEKVGIHNAQRLDGFAEDGSAMQLFFDTLTGLLVRVVSNAWLSSGEVPPARDFDDYRDVAGAKFPFLIRENGPRPTQRAETHPDKVELNVPIADSKFAMPASRVNPWMHGASR
jgi:hypothetical protein